MDLPAEAVDVWRLDRRTIDAGMRAHCIAVLSDEECKRLTGYRRSGDADRFMIGHGALRLISTMYSGVATGDLALANATDGKPTWDEPTPWLSFNISHSGDLIWLAFARSRPVGIDVQRHSERTDIDRIAEYAFHRDEAEHLARHPASTRRRAFHDHWTVREADVKATGEGMHNAVARKPLPQLPSKGWANAEAHGSRRWLCQLTAPCGYSAALAVIGGDSPPVLRLRALDDIAIASPTVGITATSNKQIRFQGRTPC